MACDPENDSTSSPPHKKRRLLWKIEIVNRPTDRSHFDRYSSTDDEDQEDDFQSCEEELEDFKLITLSDSEDEDFEGTDPPSTHCSDCESSNEGVFVEEDDLSAEGSIHSFHEDDVLMDEDSDQDDASFTHEAQEEDKFSDIDESDELMDDDTDQSSTGSQSDTVRSSGKNTKAGQENKLPRLTLQRLGFDESLPPLSSIEHIIRDLTERACELGLKKVVKRCEGRKIRVATMFSGTECPILALQLINRALSQMGLPKIEFEHQFSVEIEAFKQAYIARNFNPPYIFRDALDFCKEDAMQSGATTVYGYKAPIPGDIDILIAGFVCKCFSRLNSRRKKKIDINGPSGDTFRALLNYAKLWRPRIIIIENVKGAPWDEIQDDYFAKIGYASSLCKADSKKFYIPQTRGRGYLLCFDTRSKPAVPSLQASLNKYPELMRKMERPASSPISAFILPDKDVKEFSRKWSTRYQQGSYKNPMKHKSKERHDRARAFYGLGNGRPFTEWQENGTIRVPEFADAQWMSAISHRWLDAFDICFLRNAHPSRGSFDSCFKMRVWDVKHNVDRGLEDKEPLGVTGCILPTGIPYLSTRGGLLTGYECLALQGIPVQDILFTSESDDDLRDLAGNAMTSTVVGAAMIAGLILGVGLFRQRHGEALKTPEKPPSGPRGQSNKEMRFKEVVLSCEAIEVQSLISDAKLSSQFCHCDEPNEILKCTDCSHTVCRECLSKPSHGNMEKLSIERLPAHQFIEKWHSKFPIMLHFETSLEICLEDLGLSLQKFKHAVEYESIAQEAFRQTFQLQDIERSGSWSVVYESSEARLTLELSESVRWLLFGKPPPKLPANHELRHALNFPIARLTPTIGLMQGTWEFFIPHLSKSRLRISGKSNVPSWRSSLGISQFKDEKVPSVLHIAHRDNPDNGLSGTYHLLAFCGTASNSLYKRAESPDRPLYFFLDPTISGLPSKDAFVFSENHERLHAGGAREIIATINPSWRPWDGTTKEVRCYTRGTWKACKDVILKSRDVSIVSYAPRKLRSWMKAIPSAKCNDTSLFFSCTLPLAAGSTLSENFNSADSSAVLHQYSWFLKRLIGEDKRQNWRKVELKDVLCDNCAPHRPSVLWTQKEKSGRNFLQAFEHEVEAGLYEGRIKRTPKAIEVDIRQSTEIPLQNEGLEEKGFDLSIRVNIHTLLARTIKRFGHSGQGTKVAWRLCSGTSSPGFPSLPPFILQDNEEDEAGVSKDILKHPLKPQQQKSVAWMIEREKSDNASFRIEEVEESEITQVGLAAEGKASRKVRIRGGVLADEVSYGKTCISLAAIHDEFERMSKSQIINDIRITEGESELIRLSASLILCPAVICRQWGQEVEKFLGYSDKDVLVIKNFQDWARTTIKAFKRAKIIIAPWTIFTHKRYIEHMADFTAIPPPLATSGRAFAAWLDYAISQLPGALNTLQREGIQEFTRDIPQRLSENELREEFQAQIPSKCLVGKAYIEQRKLQTKANKPEGTKLQARSIPRLSNQSLDGDEFLNYCGPVFHLFRFNRVIIDEFSYLDRKHSGNYASIIRLKSEKRWLLSGTPVLTDFADVNRLASFFGISLGVDSVAAGVLCKRNVENLKEDKTKSELFELLSDVKSARWHERRHRLAQSFLNLFVRSNKADLSDIEYREVLEPVVLSPALQMRHDELTHYFQLNGMKLVKPNKDDQQDRPGAIRSAMDVATTPEEAMLRQCNGQEQELVDVVERRQQDVDSAVRQLQRSLEPRSEMENLIHNVGDPDALEILQGMVKEISTEIQSGEGPTSTQLTIKVQQLVAAVRSHRYASIILKGADSSRYKCAQCPAEATAIFPVCGHTACDDCLQAVTAESRGCAITGCTARTVVNPLRWANERPSSSKLGALVKLLEKIGENDQVVIFVQRERRAAAVPLMNSVKDALSENGFSFISVSGSAAADKLEYFKENAEGGPNILLLDIQDESAAGSNLTNANHVIFLSPFLAETQFEYSKAMQQAVGRVRRTGQKKAVSVYRLVALNTVEVDILESRDRRQLPMGEDDREWYGDEPSEKPEATKLVRDVDGKFWLLPTSWLCRKDVVDYIRSTEETFTVLEDFSHSYDFDEE